MNINQFPEWNANASAGTYHQIIDGKTYIRQVITDRLETLTPAEFLTV